MIFYRKGNSTISKEDAVNENFGNATKELRELVKRIREDKPLNNQKGD